MDEPELTFTEELMTIFLFPWYPLYRCWKYRNGYMYLKDKEE